MQICYKKKLISKLELQFLPIETGQTLMKVRFI